jgi:uncharacterized protein (DUF1330 family)
MSLYQLTEIRVADIGKLREYGRRAMVLVERYGGRLLTFSTSGCGEVVLEGHWPDNTILILHQWPSRESFDAFYSSNDYNEIKPIRLNAGESRLTLLEPASADPA